MRTNTPDELRKRAKDAYNTEIRDSDARYKARLEAIEWIEFSDGSGVSPSVVNIDGDSGVALVVRNALAQCGDRFTRNDIVAAIVKNRARVQSTGSIKRATYFLI